MTFSLHQLKLILANVDCRCIRSKCQDGDCCPSLEGLCRGQFALLPMDGEGSPVTPPKATRCDFLFFGQILGSVHFWVGPVELTTGVRKSSTKIVEQLQAGATLAEQLVPSEQEVQFTPLAAGPFKKNKREEFRSKKNRISFRGQNFSLKAVECCSRLAEAPFLQV